MRIRKPYLIFLGEVQTAPYAKTAQRYLQAAQLTNAEVRLVGVSLNTSALDDEARERVLSRTARELGVPCFDPMKTSPAAIVDRLVAA